MDVQDIAVVGAGPCGLSVGVAARQAGLGCVHFDKGCITRSIAGYPTFMTFFSTAEHLELGGVPFVIAGTNPSRREALKYYRRIVEHFRLDVRQYEEVVAVERDVDGFILHTLHRDGAHARHRARAVVIATGYFDTPNLLGVPGEDLTKVTHYYREGLPYSGQDCVVVGGGNSAVEAALDLFRSGARVTLVHFLDGPDARVKPWVRPDIDNRIENGEIAARWRTRVVEIAPQSVTLEHVDTGVRERLPNDWIFAMTGYTPDPGLLRSLGVSIDARTGIPMHDPETMETDVPGVFIAGVIAAGFDANKIFIENGREHGARIVRALDVGAAGGATAPR